MTILFSPVGTADPMTRLGDGPMLHLFRHYKPQRVVLFLTPEMNDHHQRDNRYICAIQDCAHLTGVSNPQVKVVKSAYDEVFRFDYYIEEFESALQSLVSADSSEEVLVNVSSGTAGMQEALVAIGAFGQLGVRLLQVVTPRKGANQRRDRENQDDYDYEALWAANPDNNSNAAPRVKEVETPNFSARLIKANIVSLLEGYDYKAASQLARLLGGASRDAADVISAAASRLTLSRGRPGKVFTSENGFDGPLAYRNGNELYEYIQMLDVRLKQGLYADYVRALTPAITETMFSYLEPYLMRRDYLTDESIQDKRNCFDAEKIARKPELETFLRSRCHVNTEDSRYEAGKVFVTNRMLMNLLAEYCPKDMKPKLGKLRKIDSFEMRVRNIMAHQVQKMNQNFIEEQGEMSLHDVHASICELNGIEPGLYDLINKRILEIL